MAPWNDVKRNLGDWTRSAAAKTNQAARIGARKLDVLSLERQRRRHLRDLGAFVLAEVREGRLPDLEDPGLKNLVAAVDDVDAALATKDEEIATIREEERAADETPTEPSASERPAEDVDADFGSDEGEERTPGA